jgi:hypothetical protein
MKLTLVRSGMLAATALLFAAGSYAQSSPKLVADINFNFRAGGADLAPGKYDVTVSKGSGSTMFIFRNQDTHKSAITIVNHMLAYENRAEPRLVFKCNPVTCGLSEVWTPDSGYAAPGVKLSPAEHERIAVVTMKAKGRVAD